MYRYTGTTVVIYSILTTSKPNIPHTDIDRCSPANCTVSKMLLSDGKQCWYPGTTDRYCTCIVHVHVECCGFESHPSQLIFLKKSDCLGYAVLLCLVVVCLTLLASFFLPSHLSLVTI